MNIGLIVVNIESTLKQQYRMIQILKKQIFYFILFFISKSRNGYPVSITIINGEKKAKKSMKGRKAKYAKICSICFFIVARQEVIGFDVLLPII